MTSETRSFTGLGSFTISYQYNLANQLSSITNPFNNTINYSHDTAGRLTSVTGTTFGTYTPVSTYASNIQYRAWDAIKSLNSGDNRTLSAGFNSRLQPSAFSVSGIISKTYDYHADGKLRFSSDLLDHRFDRSYGFDHVGRLSSAFSGAEARGEGATTNRPYKQTYGYDALSHLTARTNEIWWTSINSLSDSYVNNRRVQWQYDADGRLLSGNNAFNTYDAAGLTTHIEVPSTFSSHTSVGYDGDGRQVKTEDTTWNEDLQADVTETKHYLRSSVLGGKVLTEILDVNLTRTFVYAGQAVIAWQWRSFGSESVEWDHKDPSGASVRRGGRGVERLNLIKGAFAYLPITTKIILRAAQFCLKSLRVLLSFTPGFSPVMKDRENHRNRFNGFSVSFAGQVLRSQSLKCLEKTSKPLKRFTTLLLCLSPG